MSAIGRLGIVLFYLVKREAATVCLGGEGESFSLICLYMGFFFFVLVKLNNHEVK